ncbi:choice-of-anchor B family protein [Flavilitoribacter nigricans]|uniref:Secretion system C-terminal sorting domain-containing protein n=1 Tax=Flavilitoribacter nigricans (strain ATCC 23147 / DSM 23189 / NBRC 102662 / NCIMB 1420 / SS-2) TaxID=1122177 RepID=A0A2D0NFL1_FLAN2|nr:choice-of-anchor B family protein [Flavilitoribacter nigricans]PHN07267.1 hypothetical protein CRP01_06455 [Flavilitoribacter nigricans DSM 23189 = NBRC 102662]
MRIRLLFCPALLWLSCFVYPLFGQVPSELLGQWSNDELPGSGLYNNTYNEIWGLALDGREYAVIGSTLGTHFIDVTEPENAREVAFVTGASSGPNIIHRDYHNYGCYLYAVSDEGNGSLQIIDISGLPDQVEVVYDEDTLFGRSHNIFIDTSAAILYACYARGGEATTTPLKLLDISDPTRPQEIATYRDFGSGPVSHVHDCYVDRGIAFLNLGFDGMAIVDFSDPLNPVNLSTLTDYPFSGYNHSGWATADLHYYYLADESHGHPLKVLDVSDLTEIEVVDTFDAGSPAELSIPHNQVVACDYLYVSYYYDGLQVFDISDPAQPQRIAYYDTSDIEHRKSYEGAWGVYPFLPSGNILVSDMQEGLFILSGPDGNCTTNTEMSLTCGLLSPVRVPDTPQRSVSIFPQPAGDYLSVSVDGYGKSQEKVNVRITDIHGRLLQRWEKEAFNGNFRLSLGNAIPSGMYLLQFRIGHEHFTQKIIIRR